MTREAITAVLGWCTVLNTGVLVFASLWLVLLRGRVSPIHSRMFALDADDLARAYFQYLASYKVAIVVLNLVPYLALRISA